MGFGLGLGRSRRAAADLVEIDSWRCHPPTPNQVGVPQLPFYFAAMTALATQLIVLLSPRSLWKGLPDSLPGKPKPAAGTARASGPTASSTV